MAHPHSSSIWDGAGDTNVTLSQITVLLNGKHTLKYTIVLRMTPLLDSDRFYILTETTARTPRILNGIYLENNTSSIT
jgi:hypothetical protein